MPVRILAWKPIFKGSLIGRANVLLGKALEVHGLLVMKGSAGCWVAFPGIPKFDFTTDKIMRDARGEVEYGDVILKWSDRVSSDRFKHAVVNAITDKFGPDALNGGDQ
jgi:DNA-binding cell septation regulator SpoVG